MEFYSIAIDGPAGAGKSTIAKKVAQLLGFIYVDTGAMYRALGLYCIDNNISYDNKLMIEQKLDDINITIKYINGEQQVLLNGRNVNSLIRTNEVSSMASAISTHKCVRLKLVDLQRALAAETSVIMDGRDIGTYVLPNATLKIYLNASVDVRAKRRWLELTSHGETLSLETLKDEIKKRDHQDMYREFAPLKKATDAIEIDTSDMTIDNVVSTIINCFETREAGL